jgi:hypothetical protein
MKGGIETRKDVSHLQEEEREREPQPRSKMTITTELREN